MICKSQESIISIAKYTSINILDIIMLFDIEN